MCGDGPSELMHSIQIVKCLKEMMKDKALAAREGQAGGMRGLGDLSLQRF